MISLLSATQADAGHGFLEPPVNLHASSGAAWAITIAAMVLIAVAAGACIYWTNRERSSLPVWVFLGSMTWYPFEAFVDVPMGLWHASNNPWIAITILDRPIPLYVASTGAAFFIGTYGVYRMMLAGKPARDIVIALTALGALDWVLEMAAAQFHLIEYYGDNPSRVLGLPAYAMVQNIGVYIVQAVCLLAVVRFARGWRGFLLIPVMPAAYIAYALGCTFPAYYAIQAGAPSTVTWTAVLLAIAMNALVPLAMLQTRSVTELRGKAAALEPPVRPLMEMSR